MMKRLVEGFCLAICSVFLLMGYCSTAQAKEYDYRDYKFEKFKGNKKYAKTAFLQHEFDLNDRKLDKKSLNTAVTVKGYKALNYVLIDGVPYIGWADLDGWWYENEISIAQALKKSDSKAVFKIATEGATFQEATFTNSYVLFFKDNAKSEKDLLWVSSEADVKNHIEKLDKGKYLKSKFGYKVLDSKYDFINDRVICRIKFDLPQFKIDGSIINDYPDKIIIKSGEGEVLFEDWDYKNHILNLTLEGAKNGNMTFKFKANYGATYTFKVKIDCVTDDDEEYEEESKKVKVTVIGNKEKPKNNAVTVTIKSNLPAKITVAGFKGTKTYKNEYTVKIKDNGIYYYTVYTKGGQFIDGSFDVWGIDDALKYPKEK